MVVDPEVSREKYAAELQKVRSHTKDLESWGCFLVGEPTYPTVEFVLVPRNKLRVSLPALPNPALPMGIPVLAQAEAGVLAGRAFRIRIDMSDFDMRAPSLVFLDAWTGKVLPYSDLFRAVNFEALRGAHVVLLDDHPTTHLPFLCVRGVREYHEHPQHTGDDWMLYRADSGLFSLLATVWRTCIDLVTPNLILQPQQLLVNWEVLKKD